MKDNAIYMESFDIDLIHNNLNVQSKLELISQKDGLFIYAFSFDSEKEIIPEVVKLKWKLPYIDVKGIWKVNSVHDKRQQYDWELEHMRSRVSVGAPLFNVFGLNDKNIITVACGDPINPIEMNALLREEDNHLYCHISFFKEASPITNYSTELRIDTREVAFHQSIKDSAKWWAEKEELKPLDLPPLATAPLYSTWYNYHQELDKETLLEELRYGKELGLDLVIIDDGWQTHDSNRGYDFTGDWQAERLTNMADFVDQIHDIGVKVGLWFSVPFCGKKSKAYQRFAGKFLTENHRWAPVFDPRYPEVREYLVSTYVNAVKNWKLDALKLDFIDDFTVYPETPLGMGDGRDIASVNQAVDSLMTQVIQSVSRVNPEIVIEFRQQYVGPAMRKYGHMFRAFDCPNDPITNRIRISDVKLMCGSTAVHSDPITWHLKDSKENAAVQLINALFGVPQISVELGKLPTDQLDMLRYFLDYWRQHESILMQGKFIPHNPLANYNLLESYLNGHRIMAVYEQVWVELGPALCTDLFNASDSESLVLYFPESRSKTSLIVKDCCGKLVSTKEAIIPQGVHKFHIPRGGHIRITSNS
ncbi:MAG: alpha-galactosidase [Bacteroidia bacterium]|nr:alpha-galactosidase [Bacteroidia bacterium]